MEKKYGYKLLSTEYIGTESELEWLRLSDRTIIKCTPTYIRRFGIKNKLS
jgi:hypothetical protein